MNKQNILILNASSIYGGGEYFVLKLAETLKQMEYNIFVGCKSGGMLSEKLRSAGIEVKHIDFPKQGSAGLWKNVKHIKRIIKENNIEVVHSNTGYDRTAGAFAVRGTKCRHVSSCHSLESLSHNITHYIRNRFYTHHFIADGESIKKLITSQNNIPAEKVTVVHNGIDAAEMQRSESLREKIRAEFNIRHNEIVLGNVGRLVEFKGHKYLLTAFKIISESCPNVKLIITGDGELMEQLKEQRSSLKLNDSVIFTGFRDDLQAVYSAFDIYVNSSVEGGGELFPFTILYAMAQALPVVSPAVGDIPAMIENDVSGWLVEERSPYKIAAHTINLISNKSLAGSMGKAGRKILLNKFTLEKMTYLITNIYKNA